jgi:hypothetical protein
VSARLSQSNPSRHRKGRPAACARSRMSCRSGGVGGDDLECLVQVAVGDGDADPSLPGQRAQIQAVAQPAQYEHDLGARCRPAVSAGHRDGADAERPSRSPTSTPVRTHQGWHDETQRAPGKWRSAFGRDDLHLEGPRPLQRPWLRPATTPIKTSELVRKPRCIDPSKATNSHRLSNFTAGSGKNFTPVNDGNRHSGIY